MTQDEIIEIARQVYGECNWHKSALLRLEVFVKLVEDKEREACVKLCAEDNAQAMDFTYGTLVGGYFAEIIKARGET